jgi:hypothetical protein
MGRFHLAELTARIGAGEVVVDLEKHLQAGVVEKRLPAFFVGILELRAAGSGRQTGIWHRSRQLAPGVFDHLHAFEAGNLAEQMRLNAVRNVRARFSRTTFPLQNV